MVAALGMVHHATLITSNGRYDIPSATKQWNTKPEEKQVWSQKPLGLDFSKKARGKKWNIPENWIFRPISPCHFRKEKAFLEEKKSTGKNIYLFLLKTLKMGMKKDLLNTGWERRLWHRDAKHNQQSLLRACVAKLQFNGIHFHPFHLCTGLWHHEVLGVPVELPGRQCPTTH